MENYGGSWWLLVVVGGEEEAWDVGEGFWKKEGERNGCFPRLHEKQSLQHSSVSNLGKRSVSHTPDDILQIATVRSWKSVM